MSLFRFLIYPGNAGIMLFHCAESLFQCLYEIYVIFVVFYSSLYPEKIGEGPSWIVYL